MRPLPDINDTAAMIRQGQRSVLSAARREATERMRDAYTALQSADWATLDQHAEAIERWAQRLRTLAAMWSEVADE